MCAKEEGKEPVIGDYTTAGLPPYHFIITIVACAIGPSVTTSSTDFSFRNLVFWNLFEFSAAAEIT
jgi:hypothetical protein